jgi:fluoride exporter
MNAVLLVALGGALGAIARFHVTRQITSVISVTAFPLATLIINTTGSMGLGALLAMRSDLSATGAPAEPVHLFVGVGFLAAFTTFSTFATETHAMLTQRQWSRALAYAVSTLVLSLSGFVVTFLLLAAP